MTQELHVLSDEDQMTAARTKQYEEEKHTGIRTERNKKTRKQGRKRKRGRKTRNRIRGVDSNKASRLCYKPEPGTLSNGLPSSSYSRQQRYQVSVLPLSSPPSVN